MMVGVHGAADNDDDLCVAAVVTVDLFGGGRKFMSDGAGLAGRLDHHDPEIAPGVRRAVQALLDAALIKRSPEARKPERTGRDSSATPGSRRRPGVAISVKEATGGQPGKFVLPQRR